MKKTGDKQNFIQQKGRATGGMNRTKSKIDFFLRESEDTPKELNLGKYSFDVHQKKWMAHPSTNRAFPNAFKSDKRVAKIFANNEKVAGNTIVDNFISLHFEYKFDKQQIESFIQNARISLRTTYEIIESTISIYEGQEKPQSEDHQVLIIDVKKKSVAEIMIPRAKRGEFTFESIFDDDVDQESWLSYRLKKGSGSIELKSIELIAMPRAPATQLRNYKQAQNQAQTDQLDKAKVSENNFRMRAKLFDSDVNAGRNAERSDFDFMSLTMDNTAGREDLNGIEQFMNNRGQLYQMPQALNTEDNTKTIHEEYNLANKLKDMNGLQDYQDLVEFKIPLNELYELWAACLHTDNTRWCAVLLQIKNKTILEKNGGNEFLLQIWQDNKQMIFEKSLKQPICNWNLTGANFLFQEKPGTPDIYLVTLRENFAPQIHLFELHANIAMGQVNTYYDPSLKRLIVPPENLEEDRRKHLMSDNSDYFIRSADSFRTNTDVGSYNKKPTQEQEKQYQKDREMAEKRLQETPFCKRFSHDIVNRAPDKMCDYTDGFIVLAYRKTFYYFDVREHLLDENLPNELTQEITIEEEKVRMIPLRENKKIICFPEMNSDQSCMVIEDLQTREVSFLAFKLVDDTSATNEVHDLRINNPSSPSVKLDERTSVLHEIQEDVNQIIDDGEINGSVFSKDRKQMLHPPKKMMIIGLSAKDTKPPDDDEEEDDDNDDDDEQKERVKDATLQANQLLGDQEMGAKVTIAKTDKAKLFKFRSSSMQEEENGSWSQVSLLLREDGSVEVYSNFIYVGKIYDKERPCIDIETGARNFFFRLVKKDAIQLTPDLARMRKAYSRNTKPSGDLYSHANNYENDEYDQSDQILLEQQTDLKMFDNENLIFIEPEDLLQEGIKQNVEIRRVKKSWKNRIGQRTMQKEQILDGWEEVLHERVAPFYKLYTAMTNIATFMLVSHRNMLSVFNMGEMEDVVENENEKEQSTSWVDTVQVSKPNYHIRTLQIVKRKNAEILQQEEMSKNKSNAKTKRKKGKKWNQNKEGKLGNSKAKAKKNLSMVDKFEICCLIGPNKLVYLSINEKGKFKTENYDSGTLAGLQTRLQRDLIEFEYERVLTLVNDEKNQFGMILLIEEIKASTDRQTRIKAIKDHQLDDEIIDEQGIDLQGIDFVKKLECYIYLNPFKQSGSSGVDQQKDKQPGLKIECYNKRESYLLLTVSECQKEQYVTRGTQLGLRRAKRDNFTIKKTNNRNPCEVNEVWPKKMNQKYITALSLGVYGSSKLWPIRKIKNKQTKRIEKIGLLKKNKKNQRTFDAGEIEPTKTNATETLEKVKNDADSILEPVNKQLYRSFVLTDQPLDALHVSNNEIIPKQQTQDDLNKMQKEEQNDGGNDNDDDITEEDDFLLTSFFLTNKDFDEYKGSYFRISKDKIRIFNPDQSLLVTYKGFKFQEVIQVQETFLYASQDANYDGIEIEDPKTERAVKVGFKHVEGLYVYNIKALLERTIEPYRVSSQGTGGGATLLQYNTKHGRLAFMEDYNTIVVIPLPQLNIINFIGMRNKQQYLMWREKRGFFTALNKQGKLYTWSILTGKLLYDEKTTFGTTLEDYEVYQSDSRDITYTQNAYNLPDHSLTLLKTKKPMQNEKQKKTRMTLLETRMLPKISVTKKEMTTTKDTEDNFNGMNFEKCSEIFEDGPDHETKDSALKFQFYHFKVMQLKTYEDNKPAMSECKVKFEFEHRLIQKPKKDEDKEKTVIDSNSSSIAPGEEANIEKKDDTKASNVNDIEADIAEETLQRLYLSKNTKLLMEVINNRFAIVYKRTFKMEIEGEDDSKENVDEESNDDENMGRSVRWKADYKITRWPSNLTDKTSVPFMFSPNFTYQIDFDRKKKAIIILETATQKEYLTIPTDMINTEWRKASEKNQLLLIFSRMKWVQDELEDKFHILTQTNLDCIYKIVENKETEMRWLELISVCKIDNMHTDVTKPDSPHFFHEPYTLQTSFVTERLIRMNQDFKRAMQHAINMRKFDNDEEGFIEHMVEHVQQIDYMQPWSDIDSYFAIEMSFTWLDWLIIEEAISNEKFKMKHVSDQQKLQLAQNVLPNGKGILHLLANNRKAKMSHINKLAKELFEFSKGESDTNLHLVEEPVILEIPFLNDYNQKTALDICLDVQSEISEGLCPATRKLFCSPRDFIRSLQTKKKVPGEKEDMEKVRVSSKNIMLADIILENIQKYGVLHSSQQILDALIVGSRLGLPAVKSYLDSRIKQTDHPLLVSSHPKINVSYLKTCTAIDGDYGTITASIYGPVSKIKDQIFKSNGAKQPTRFETIDLPELFQQGERGRNFIEALTECNDPDFFTKKSVQVLIDHHYQFWYKINLYSVLIPAFIQLAFFWAWSNFILPIHLKTIEAQEQDSIENLADGEPLIYILKENFNYGDLNSFFKVVLFIITLYLICYDLSVLAKTLWQFNEKDSAPSRSFYQIFNMLLHMLVLTSVIGASDDRITTVTFWQMQSWVALAVWLRIVVTYLGEIQEFSWLVGLIKYSCKTTIYFLTVFVCLVTAFTDAYNALDQKLLINGGHYEGKSPDLVQEQKEKNIDVSFTSSFYNWLDIWQIAFRSSIGDFEQLSHLSYLDWVIFFLTCFSLIILMLNLLISVISEAQTSYTEARVQSTYKEKAMMIRQKGNSFFWFFYQQTKPDHNTLLYIVQQASSKEELQQLQENNSAEATISDILGKIESIADNIENMNDNNDDKQLEDNGMQNSNTRTISRMSQGGRVSSSHKVFENAKSINATLDDMAIDEEEMGGGMMKIQEDLDQEDTE